MVIQADSSRRQAIRNREMDELLDMQEKREFCEYEDCVWVEDLGAAFQAMRHDEDLTDIKLCVGETEFACHRLMLAASSPFFRAMLVGPMRERSRERVELRDARPATVELLLNYMYTGKLKITEENVEELLVTANYLLLGRLVDACSDFLRRQLDVHNCFEMLSFAEAHCCGELKRAANRFILKNFGQICTSASLLDASCAQLQALLGADNLNTPDEKQVFDAVIRWVSHDPATRTDNLSDLLKLARLPYLPEATLDALSAHPLLASCPKSRTILEKARHCKTDFITYPQEWKSPRRSTNQGTVLVILGGVQSSQPGNRSSLEHYCCDMSMQPVSWMKQAIMPYMLRNTVMYDVTLFRNAIYVTGGFDGELGALRHVWRYQMAEDRSETWARIPSLNAARYQHGCAVLRGQLFVVGGFNGQDSLVEVECYKPEWDQWRSCPPMTEAVTFPAAVGYNESLYVIGGMKADSCAYPWMQCFNVSNQTWSVIRTLELKTKGCKSVLLNDAIYILGGPSRDVHVYDPENDCAFDVAPTHDFHVCAAATANNGKLYIAGGDNLKDRNNWDHIECYDPATNAWSLEGKTPTPLYWHGMVSMVRDVQQLVPPVLPHLIPLGPSMLFRGFNEGPIDYDPR